MKGEEHFPTATEADVALLLEGTFPYVSGGVSSWVNQIIRAFPDIRFALVFLGSRREDYGELKYTLPDNVVHLETHFLHDSLQGRSADIVATKGDPHAFARIACDRGARRVRLVVRVCEDEQERGRHGACVSCGVRR